MRSTVTIFMTLAGLLYSGLDAFGQHKLGLSATVAPFYGHVKTRVEVLLPEPNGSGILTSQVFESKSSAKGYWVGLNGRYSFTQKWSASTGLWFGHHQTKTSTSNARSRYFLIPVMANFQTSERKLSPYLSAGATWNFRTTSRVQIPDFGTVTFKSDKNTSRISAVVGAGVIYHVGQRLALIAQPTFSYAIPPAGLDIHAYQLSLNMQAMFKF